MYRFEANNVKKGLSRKYLLFRQDERLSYQSFLDFLQDEASFRSFFIDLLSHNPFPAFHWETPPVSETTLDQPFEFVVTNSPGIDLRPDPNPFQRYFDKAAGHSTAVFPNLGHDALLIAPVPPAQDSNYSHIGAFTRNAPEEKQHDLWRKTGEEAKKQISDRPLWLNTAGGGVAWLHIRLDSRPKYYRHLPYAKR